MSARRGNSHSRAMPAGKKGTSGPVRLYRRISGRSLWMGIACVGSVGGALFAAYSYHRNTVGGDMDAPPFATTGLTVPSGVLPPVGEFRVLIDEAVRMVGRLRNRFPEAVEPLHIVAGLHSRLGEADQALKVWQACLALDAHDADAHVRISQIYVDTGEYAKAEQAAGAAVRLDPGNPQAPFFLGAALFHQGKLQEAIDILEACHTADSDLLGHLVLLGQAYLQVKQYAKAKECFASAARLVPDYANAYHGLAAACAGLGEKEDAARYRQQLKELHAKQLRERIEESRHPNDLQATQQIVAESYVAAGRFYLMQGDARTAEQHWLRAIELDSRNEQGRAALTQLLERQGRLREALRVLQPLAASLAKDAGFWLQLGQLQARLADHAQAETSFRQVVQIAPQRALGYVALAQLYLQSETRAAEAVQSAREAVRCEPSAGNYFLLSTACERAGDLPAAREAIEKALQLEPGNGQYRQTALALYNRL